MKEEAEMSHIVEFGRSRPIRSFKSTDLKRISKFQYEISPWARQRVINKILTHAPAAQPINTSKRDECWWKVSSHAGRKKKCFGQRNPPNLIQFHPTASSALNLNTGLFSHLGSVAQLVSDYLSSTQTLHHGKNVQTPHPNPGTHLKECGRTFVSWMQHF